MVGFELNQIFERMFYCYSDIKNYIKFILFFKDNITCNNKELKQEIKSLGKSAKVQKSLRNISDKIYFDDITRRTLEEFGLKTSYYPTKNEKLQLVNQTGLTYKQITRWYQNFRYENFSKKKKCNKRKYKKKKCTKSTSD